MICVYSISKDKFAREASEASGASGARVHLPARGFSTIQAVLTVLAFFPLEDSRGFGPSWQSWPSSRSRILEDLDRCRPGPLRNQDHEYYSPRTAQDQDHCRPGPLRITSKIRPGPLQTRTAVAQDH